MQVANAEQIIPFIKTVATTELHVSKEWNRNERGSIGSVISIILWHFKHSLASGMAWRAR